MVWLVWDKQFLKGMFVVRDAAEQRSIEVRAERGVVEPHDPQGFSVRVEPLWVNVPPEHAAGHRNQVLRDAIDVIRRDWGLLNLPELGTGHHFRLDRYLAIPVDGRLTYPRFQFNDARELWPGFSDVLTVFRDAAWDDVSTSLWFISRQGSTGGDIPALVIQHDPDEVLSAARLVVDDW
ncbi:hypothetical protein EAH86_09745 [Pedococcus bigeumensis]|uniref:Antitoxin Xre/MbcA/ParS-like toxin-binding domain-containing protein n=1 Tax=Pedococcus bigeumensis TaxID=433644 RepID=A0A502CY11_9MICO|nr:hypothetical protein EAH86_09745 [Pedococcus bigeumensis]